MNKDTKWNNVKCIMCGKEFHLKPSALKRFKTHYCSKQCQNEARKVYMRGEGNHQYGIKGDKNASWVDKSYKMNSHGYRMLRIIEHPFADKNGWVFEHRVVAEKHLLTDSNSINIDGKRYLHPDYCVHHLNFDRADNRVENLVVMTKIEHRIMHNKLNPLERDNKGQFVSDDINVIKIKRVTDTAIIPERCSDGAAGFDLCIDSAETIVIPPHSTVMVQSGIAFEIPKGYFGAIYARSGISTRQGIRPATCVSVIDSDYRGSVGLPLHNDTDVEKVIEPYSRVAQIVIQRAFTPTVVVADSLEETERGDNGFGSTGR